MQHDVFVDPLRRMRGAYPYIAVLQSDYVEDEERIVAPLVRLQPRVVTRAYPAITVGDAEFRFALIRMFAMPTRLLRRPIGSVAAYHDDIIRALDWLFTGV